MSYLEYFLHLLKLYLNQDIDHVELVIYFAVYYIMLQFTVPFLTNKLLIVTGLYSIKGFF